MDNNILNKRMVKPSKEDALNLIAFRDNPYSVRGAKFEFNAFNKGYIKGFNRSEEIHKKEINNYDSLLEALHLVVGSMSLERVERFDILEKCKAAISEAEK